VQTLEVGDSNVTPRLANEEIAEAASEPIEMHSDERLDPANAPSSANNTVLYCNPRPPDLDDGYWRDKERIVRVEQHVLRWLAFDCYVSHPHRAAVLMAERLFLAGVDSEKNRIERDKVAQRAWRQLNDAIFSVEALGHAVLPLAAAAVDLALLKVRQNENNDGQKIATGEGRWWERINLEVCEEAVWAAKSSLEVVSSRLQDDSA